MLKLSTPISRLFLNESFAEQIIGLSDSLECREWWWESPFPRQELFHFDINIIHRWDDKRKQFIRRSVDSKPELALATFHMAACCDEPRLQNGVYRPGGREYSREEMLERAVINAGWLRTVLPTGTAIGVENTNYYPTPAYACITEGSFITDIVATSGVNLLYDIAHGKITAHNRRIDYGDYVAELPLASTIQLHISGPRMNADGIAYDAHDYPDEAIYREVESLIDRYPIKYVTVELYGEHSGVVRELERYKRLKDGFNG